jgi:hypothetical protein
MSIGGQKDCYISAAPQSADGHAGPLRNSNRLNARTVHPVEVPDERQYLEESVPIRWSSPRLNTRVIARQAQDSFEHSSQITSVARGKRMSKVACAKLPSLIHSSPACACFISALNAARSFCSKRGWQRASKQMTGAPVRLPSCRAKVVFPLPAQPKMTIRAIDVGYCRICVTSRVPSSNQPSRPTP